MEIVFDVVIEIVIATCSSDPLSTPTTFAIKLHLSLCMYMHRSTLVTYKTGEGLRPLALPCIFGFGFGYGQCCTRQPPPTPAHLSLENLEKHIRKATKKKAGSTNVAGPGSQQGTRNGSLEVTPSPGSLRGFPTRFLSTLPVNDRIMKNPCEKPCL